MLAEAPQALVGCPRPRIAPPLPLHSDVDEFRKVAEEIGIELMPWQVTSATYTEARAPDGRNLYREICELVGRQNGKTEKIVPLVVKRLRAGRRLTHTAQNRDRPREVFDRVAEIMSQDTELFPRRGGRLVMPRFANGQEEIKLHNGGRYKIVAPTRGGARGGTNDDVIIDEVRELESFEFIGAAKPTMATSPDPQMLYYSNAGDDDSAVLNSIRDRQGKDPRLAWIEWSADPERADDDPLGWAEANPSIGHIPSMFEFLEGEYLTHKLGGTLSIFQTEHLCRWVATMRQALIDVSAWNACEVAELPAGRRVFMGIAMDPEGTRASAALAWLTPDGKLAVRMTFDVTGSPINVAALGADLAADARRRGIRGVGFDPMTDGELAKYFPKTQKPTGVTATAFANATAEFVNAIEGQRLQWTDAAAATNDLPWTARKDGDERGAFSAVRANDDRPITAVLAIIRAIRLASGPRPAAPRAY